MRGHIEVAASCLRRGDHGGAVVALRELETGDEDHALRVAAQCLNDEEGTHADVYIYFVALKVFTFALTRCRSSRHQQCASAVTFLLDYGYRKASQFESAAWMPVVSELTTAAAVALKLGCVSDDLEIGIDDVTAVWSGLMCTVQSCSPCSKGYLHRIFFQSAVEEFGLFSSASRYRGVPVRVHRRCREAFAAEGRLPRMIEALLCGLLESTDESEASVDKGLAALVSCFAWPSHQYFDEDSSSEESCGVFLVSHPEWDRLLVGGFTFGTGVYGTIQDLLRRWYGEGALKGIPVDRQKVVEIIQLLCSFKGSGWGEEQSLMFLEASLSLCLDVFEHLSQCAAEGEMHLFPLLANAIQRLVSNFVEYFFSPATHSLTSRLVALTCNLLHRNMSHDPDANVMSCLDEVLSAWYHLTMHIDRNSFSVKSPATLSQCHLISEGCRCIFSNYLEINIGVNAVEMEEDYFTDTFTNSHVHLVAQIGRVCASATCELISASSERVWEALTYSLSSGGHISSSLLEALWTLMKVVGFFIADPSDGEQPYIPRCFLEIGSQGSTALLQVVSAVSKFLSLLQKSALPSPAVHAALLGVLGRYIRTYVEADESCPVYNAAFEEGAEIVAQSLLAVTASLQLFPFEQDSTSAACSLLDCIAEKSTRVRTYCLGQDAFLWLVEAAAQIDRYRFFGRVRGRLIAFVLSCCPDADAVQLRLRDFALSLSEDDDANMALEKLSTLDGLFESLHSQEVIRSVFPTLLTAGQRLIRFSAANFFERTVAIESVRFVRSIFVACAPLLEDAAVHSLLELVVAELRCVVRSLQERSTWSMEGDEEVDKAQFTIDVAKLLSSMAQWKTLDCCLPEDETRALSTATVETVGHLLRRMDDRTLSLPDLEDSLFTCLEVCAESFTADLVFASDADAFFSATLYALHSERFNIQRAGISLTACVAIFLAASEDPSHPADPCCNLLRVILQALTSGKIFSVNVRQISRALLALMRVLREEHISAVVRPLSSEATQHTAFWAILYPALQAAAGQASLSESWFEERIQDSLSSVRGTAIIGS